MIKILDFMINVLVKVRIKLDKQEVVLNEEVAENLANAYEDYGYHYEA